MSLVPGARLGAYEILTLIGAGGMGEVYRARDTRLDRLVAVKVATVDFSERFEREARAIARLNHPHICTLHDVGPNYLVMEYIDGAPLRVPVPIDQALVYAAQIASALDAAHQQHVIHRDLKPSNILVTGNGVKLLDFGIARLGESQETHAAGATAALTARSLTIEGTIVGTAQYMSPEQARGLAIDKRTDIWAFGCVLFEMLAGRAPFAQETTTDTLAAIVNREPDWRLLPGDVPGAICTLLRRCLQKDPQHRLRDIGDARLEIAEAIAAPVTTDLTPTAGRRPIMRWVAASAVLASAITAGLLVLTRGTPEIAPVDVALTIAPPSASGIQPVESIFARPVISPDGSVVAYLDLAGKLQLRWLNAVSPRSVQTVAGAFSAMIWSADSKYLVFPDNTALKRIRIPDGAPETIGTLPPSGFPAGSLSDTGILLFLCCTPGTARVFLAPPGAEGQAITIPGLKEGTPSSPSFLPGSEDFLIGLLPPGTEDNETYLVSVRDGKPIDAVLLTRNTAGLQYSPAGGGRVLFVRNNNLYAQRLNRTARRLEGDPDLIQEGVASRGTGAAFSVSRTGVIAWRPGRAVQAQVTIFDRHGARIGTAGVPGASGALHLSPDERRVIIATRDHRGWLLEPGQPGRLNLTVAHLSMLWTPDSTGVIVPDTSGILERPINGSSEGRERARVPGTIHLEDLSNDGKLALFRDGASTLFSVRLDGGNTSGPAVVQTNEPVGKASFSPDGRWIVYHLAEAQRDGIYVQAFPGPSLRKQIASTGQSPMWRKDGKEILYLDRDHVWSVRVDTSAGDFRASSPDELFPVRSLEGGRKVNGIAQLAVTRDGSRIYYQQPVEQPDSDVIHIKIGWPGAHARP